HRITGRNRFRHKKNPARSFSTTTPDPVRLRVPNRTSGLRWDEGFSLPARSRPQSMLEASARIGDVAGDEKDRPADPARFCQALLIAKPVVLRHENSASSAARA